MGKIGDVENKAERMLAEQGFQFEVAARRYKQEARDVSQVEVAKERASVQSLKQSLINAEQVGADKTWQ
eukprot:10621945-Karenia_brevis.AAC.1